MQSDWTLVPGHHAGVTVVPGHHAGVTVVRSEGMKVAHVLCHPEVSCVISQRCWGST